MSQHWYKAAFVVAGMAVGGAIVVPSADAATITVAFREGTSGSYQTTTISGTESTFSGGGAAGDWSFSFFGGYSSPDPTFLTGTFDFASNAGTQTTLDVILTASGITAAPGVPLELSFTAGDATSPTFTSQLEQYIDAADRTASALGAAGFSGALLTGSTSFGSSADADSQTSPTPGVTPTYSYTQRYLVTANAGRQSFTQSVTPVPLPASALLLVAAFAGLGGLGFANRQRPAAA